MWHRGRGERERERSMPISTDQQDYGHSDDRSAVV